MYIHACVWVFYVRVCHVCVGGCTCVCTYLIIFWWGHPTCPTDSCPTTQLSDNDKIPNLLKCPICLHTIHVHPHLWDASLATASQPLGGGGHSQYILVEVCRSTSKKGGLRHGHNPQKGGLRHGYNPNRGVLGTGTSRKRGVLRTGLVKRQS